MKRRRWTPEVLAALAVGLVALALTLLPGGSWSVQPQVEIFDLPRTALWQIEFYASEGAPGLYYFETHHFRMDGDTPVSVSTHHSEPDKVGKESRAAASTFGLRLTQAAVYERQHMLRMPGEHKCGRTTCTRFVHRPFEDERDLANETKIYYLVDANDVLRDEKRFLNGRLVERFRVFCYEPGPDRCP